MSLENGLTSCVSAQLSVERDHKETASQSTEQLSTPAPETAGSNGKIDPEGNLPFWDEQREAFVEPLQLPFEAAGSRGSPEWKRSDWLPPLQETGDRESTKVLLDAFVIYLARLTNRTKIPIGWHVTDNAEYVNTLIIPMVVELSLENTWSSIFSAIDTELSLLSRQCSFAKDNIRRQPSELRPSLAIANDSWRVVISMNSYDKDQKHEGLIVEGALLMLQIANLHGHFRWIYDETKLSPEVIGRMSEHLRVLAEAMLDKDQSNRSIGQLNFLPARERELLLKTWNDTEKPFPKHLCLHQLFEQQVARTPTATALVYGEETLTYEELNGRANYLARELRRLGVGPDKLVPICIARSTAMVVGVFAIMKAGGAYVPLDPAYPCERLGHVLREVDSTILIADDVGCAAMDETMLRKLTVLDPNAFEASVEDNPTVSELTSKHLAYVIYTSGSTGQPKGVMIEHRGIVNFVLSQRPLYGITATSKVMQFASIGFDVSIEEIMSTLNSGATLFIADDAIRHDPNRRWDYITDHEITHVISTPLFMQKALLPSATMNRLTIILGGEACNKSLVQDFQGCASVLNVYGVTECSISSTVWRCELSYIDEIVPVGRPISNTRIYLLDAYNRPVPLGSVGEIYIGGAGVARGYLKRPDLTDKVFMPDPFVADSREARMYRTGDLGRYNPDGVLVFLGRNDKQVKIRGFRIELCEIEAVLSEYPAVREAVIVPYGDEGNLQLIAYVVTDDIQISAKTLRMHLTNRLPRYMIPSAFVTMNKFPLSHNGKLDHKALPKPDSATFARQAYEKPRGRIENALASAWSELLDVQLISRHDSFFALGGHSLLAARLLNRVAALGVELSISTLFASTSLAELADVISSRLREKVFVSPTVTRVPRQNELPLSYAQEQLWFVTQLDGARRIHNISVALHMRGSFDATVWQRALDTTYARHEALRSVFIPTDGKPKVRLLDPNAGIQTIFHDLRGRTDVEVAVKQLCEQDANETFNLETGPLIRNCLVRISDDEHVCLITQHHIISDGWSIAVLMNELGILYSAFIKGQANPLPPLDIQYPDYAAWQSQWLTVDRMQFHSNFWRDVLRGAPVLLDLPFDRSRPSRQSYIGDAVPITFDAELTRSLNALSKQNDATLFMTILTAWSTVLSRLSGQDDLVIGTPCANRTHQELEPLIGFFVNMLALRIDLSGSPNARELLSRVRQASLEAQDHQDLPFARVVDALRPTRSLAYTPIFQVIFAWRNNQNIELSLPELDVSTPSQMRNTVQFDLELNLSETNDRIVGSLNFAKALFDKNTIERHVEYVRKTLQAMVLDAQQSLVSIDILTPVEKTLLLKMWNATETQSPDNMCLHELFHLQVERTPEAVAVACEGQTLTYAELNARANLLAHRLIEAGMGPDQLVGICTARSPAMIVGIFAILKAGAAYVPFDPSFASDRLLRILKDTECSVVIADEVGRATLRKDVLVELEVLDPNSFETDCSIDNPKVDGLTSKHLAYVIYTSGSTGEPKGVMIEHRGVVNSVLSQRSRFGINASSRVMQFASMNFDVSVEEIMTTLISGATLVIAAGPIRQDPNMLWDYIADHGISYVTLTPSFLRNAPLPSAIMIKPNVIIGGEACSRSLVQNLQGYANILNVYGLTECSISSTVWTSEPSYNGNVVPIGRPISNTRIYLLDPHGQLVPLGAVGEIYIGGVGVARGFLKRQDLTDKVFMPDPFADSPAARMYRTGDLGRYSPGGDLIFMGRNDKQIKIRGFRIEPDEIEACLLEYPTVRGALVVPRNGEEDSSLVAYVATGGIDVSAQTLRMHLTRRLPEYMIPRSFVRLDKFPLTTNGKVDHRRLPEPDSDALPRQLYEAPQGNVETILATVWSDLLGVERVSRHDNFFALGGHSLLAIRMIHIAAARGVFCSLNDLFSCPVVAELAFKIRHDLVPHSSARTIPVCVKSGGSEPPIFFFPTGTGDFSYAFALARDIRAECPIYALPWPSANEPRVSNLNELASRMLRLLKSIQSHGPYRLFGYSGGGVLAYAVAELLEETKERVTFLGLIDGDAPQVLKAGGVQRRHWIAMQLVEESGNKRMQDILSLYNIMDDMSLIQIVEAAQKLQIYPSTLSSRFLAQQMEQKLHYVELCCDYEPKPLFCVVLHQFHATEVFSGSSFETKLQEARAIGDRSLGWTKVIPDSAIRLIPIPGNHITMLDDADKRIFLSRAIDDALGKSEGSSI